ncbi:GGDEF domain-containing protein [Terrihabitans soli]|uniref:diguanylate cyclase n=1 Tax=Terrihabitans soli TaxID=708113 RepID=A0A6S6QW30_9HYPH|nr:GGDEF domain-containing protein [Terrihabitans soli]BCJ90718.1 GGDEF domain-containing protein [Terrihabitans soli]
MSDGSGDDFERTIVFGESAIERIKAYRHPAYPRIYEVWYTYATCYNPLLNQAINDVLKKRGSLSEQDLDALYDMHLSASRFPTRYDEVGTKIREEVDHMVAMLDKARGSADEYSTTLDSINKTIEDADKDKIKAIVEMLMRATIDMRSTNGELEDQLITSREEMLKLHDKLEAIRAESLTDPLTLLSNRKFFDMALEKALSDGKPFSLLVTDIDHFKSFNDKYGHLTGDQVLRLVATAVKQNVKGQDIAARYGGEEFAIILPGTTLRPAVTVADHIRRAVMGKELVKRSTGENLGRVTISIGVASFHSNDNAATIIERADMCLYAAKRAGRNRVVCETDPEVQNTGANRVA